MSEENILEASQQQITEPSALWSVLDESSDGLNDFYFRWLQYQCGNLPAVVQGVLILKSDNRNTYIPVAKWPLDAKATRLAEVAEQVLTEKCGLLVSTEDGTGHVAAAYPVVVNEEMYGVVGLELSSQDQRDIDQVMSQLQWSVGWIEALVNRTEVRSLQHQANRLQSSMRLLAAVQSEPGFISSSMALATELATQLNCSRVSIGFPRGREVRVEALSHSSQFSKQMNLIRAISAAMEEAIILGTEINYPSTDGDALVCAEHQALAKQFSSANILTLPVYANDKYYCVITLERDQIEPFRTEDIEYCRSIAALTAPSLEEKRLNDRNIWLKIKDSLEEQLQRFIGAGYIGRKLTAGVAALLMIFFTFATGDYRVSADAVLEGEFQRVIAAPFNGYLAEVGPRAGDVVEKGELICLLDDKELRLERLSYLSERAQYQKEYQKALADQERAQLNISRAQIEQTEAVLNLVESKLARTRVVAPFQGILISGDLSKRIGGYVEQGEELFSLAPLGGYRLILNVDEHAIADIAEGQKGDLVLAAFPNEMLKFELTSITPETRVLDGINTFRVKASLTSTIPSLRPGLEGVGKIYAGERKLIDIWTRGLRIWLRLWFWSWIP